MRHVIHGHPHELQVTCGCRPASERAQCRVERTAPLGLEVDRIGEHEIEVSVGRDDGADEVSVDLPR